MRKITPKQDEYMTGIKPGIMKKEKSPKIYPKIHIDLEHLPEAKKWDIGKQYSLEMVVKMVGISISKYDNSAEFEIRKIGSEDVGEAEKEEEDEDKEGEGDEEKESAKWATLVEQTSWTPND